LRVFFLFFILLNVLHANIIIDNKSQLIDSFEISYYNDTTGTLSIDEIMDVDFNRTLSNGFALNHTEGKDWFKFTLHNNSNTQDFLLYANDVWWEKFNLYSVKNAKLIKTENGLHISYKEREIKDTHPVFSFHIDKGKSKTFFIQGDALLGSTQKISIYTDESLYRERQLLSIGLYMLYIGAAFVIILLNLFLFFTLKEKIYLYYVLYVFAFTMTMMTIEGLIEYLFPHSYYSLHFFAPMAIGMLILFSREILETSIHTPKTDKFLIFLTGLMFLFTLLVFIDPLTWFMLFNNFLPLPPFVILFAAIFSWRNGSNEAKYYVLFMILYIISLFIFAFLSLGLLEYNAFTRYAYIISSFFEITLFSLVLANRFNKTKHEKQKVELDLQKSKEIAYRDELTTLYNRHYLKFYLSTCFSKARRESENVSIIMLDIDHFKSVNDTYGHAVGDIVLKNVAATLNSSMRQSDVLFRYGGEEFVIVLPNTDLQNTQSIAEKSRTNIQKLKNSYDKDKELSITISLGISLLTQEDSSLETVIKRADEALYISKELGRNRVSVHL